MVTNIITRAWNYRVCIGCLTSPLRFSAPRSWYAWCQSWQFNFTYRLYSFQTKLFCIIVLEVRSFVGTDWFLMGPILLKSPIYCINVKVSNCHFRLDWVGFGCGSGRRSQICKKSKRICIHNSIPSLVFCFQILMYFVFMGL